jgi:hypothetical protein
MPAAEFWRLTPAQFFRMCELAGERIKREDRRTGMLLTVIRRILGDKKAELWDFFPEHKDVVADEKARVAKVKANMRALVGLQKAGKK